MRIYENRENSLHLLPELTLNMLVHQAKPSFIGVVTQTKGTFPLD